MRWGIISTAKIARQWVIPATQSATGQQVVAIGSRDAVLARQVAESHGIERVVSLLPRIPWL
jgi:D-xylose 1-dehydrogenase (NADP+, D-xylono-1,5-lactone-forming)